MSRLAEVLPLSNAIFNGLAVCLMLLGWLAIRSKRPELHRRLMLAATGSSVLFLVGYITRVALTGTHRFPGSGWFRTVYLGVLGSHTLLALGAAPLVLTTLYWALRRRQFETHRKIGRITLPIWLYVSATGVVIYLMLYR